MSRIGKRPIEIPEGVTVTLDGNTVKAKGPLGEQSVVVVPEINVKIEGNEVILTRANDDRKVRALHGLSRTLVSNAINGVKTAFVKKLEIQGVGYRAAMQGTTLNLVLGYSHPINIEPPKSVKIEVEQTQKLLFQVQTNRKLAILPL